MGPTFFKCFLLEDAELTSRPAAAIIVSENHLRFAVGRHTGVQTISVTLLFGGSGRYHSVGGATAVGQQRHPHSPVTHSRRRRQFLARDVLNWRIIANLGFKFRSKFTAQKHLALC